MTDHKGYDFSATRRLLSHWVETGQIAGASLQVIRKGETLLASQVGFADLEKRVPLASDSIFRIYSMTKPLTAILLMMLYEKGLVHLQDPVADYLPEFKNPRVWQEENGQWTTRPARQPITLHHLMTMTSGIPYHDGDHPANQAITKLVKSIAQDPAADLRSAVSALGEIPLCFDPGDRWRYGLSLDVIGAVIEVVTGQKLSQYLRSAILDPLGMKDTDFYVPEAKKHRLAQIYVRGQNKHLIPHQDQWLTPGQTDPHRPPQIEFGGAGLFSTRADYIRFARMLLAGGTLDGVRILSQASMRLITCDHLSAACRKDFSQTTGRPGYSYGLGMQILVNQAQAQTLAYPGEFGWGGAAGTWFRIDPREELIALYLSQHMPGQHDLRIPPIQATIYAAL